MANRLKDDDLRNLIDHWKDKTDPLELVAQIETPRRQGQVYFIHCPFHDDQHKPNMAVYEDGFHCFACGWHGDLVAFVMAIQGWSFRDFVDYLRA